MCHTHFIKWGGCNPSSLHWRRFGSSCIQLKTRVCSMTLFIPCIVCFSFLYIMHAKFHKNACVLFFIVLSMLYKAFYPWKKKSITNYTVPSFTFTSMKFHRYRSNIMQIYTLIMPIFFCCRKRDIHSVWRCQILPLWRCARPLVHTSGITFTFFAIEKMKAMGTLQDWEESHHVHTNNYNVHST